MTPAPFAAAVFLSAALLFVAQPLVGKQFLPLAGGGPGVWNACLAFFQLVLLLGYLYAHALGRLPVRRQVFVHAGVSLLGAALLLLTRLEPNPALLPDAADAPALDLFAALAVCAGGPVFVLAATAPLVQRWFAGTGRDPYPLYAASNAGSLLGLLAYPLLLEPLLPVSDQRAGWGWAFAAGVLLVAGCGVRGSRFFPPSPLGGEGTAEPQATAGVRGEPATGDSQGEPGCDFPQLHPSPQPWPSAAASPPPQGGRGRQPDPRWLLLPALTAALLSAVTAHLTTDVAPVPLLWVIPLGVYLATFVVAFGRWPDRLHKLAGRAAPMGLCFAAVALLLRAADPPAVVAAVHLSAFALVGLVAHGELARSRPPAERLTGFYLWVALGGVLGGLFVALAAPVIFAKLGPVEYPLLLALAGFVRPRSSSPTRLRWDDFAAPLLVGLTAGLLAAFAPAGTPDALGRLLRGGLVFGLPAAAAFALAWRPVRFALALGAVLVVGSFAPGPEGDTVLVARNFFGTLRVTRGADGFTKLWHGTTQHGMQRTDTRDSPAPTMYYHRKGPLGRLFAAAPPGPTARVGVVGLGVGATAAYATPGQSWVFFEIDPGVIRVASDDRYFTFLSTCRAKDLAVVPGDARRRLAADAGGGFDLLVLDAFSSDAIPTHLLTREAFALYLWQLRPGGVLAFHLSNRYLDLPPLVARLAADADPGLVVRRDEDAAVSDAEAAAGKAPSTWVFVARRLEDLGARRVGLDAVTPLPPGRGWTDDFSNLLGVWRTNED